MKKYYNEPELILDLLDEDVMQNSGAESYDSENVLDDNFDRDWGIIL